MTISIPLQVTPSAFSGLIGCGRRDTTPPDGIYARMWGAASHDLATGVHRPLTTTALALQSAGGRPRLLVALDIALLGDLGGVSDAERVLAPVREALSLEPGELLVNCSHTHAAPWAAMSRSHNPGGELIGPYLDQLSQAILEAGREAIDGLAPATLTWATGRCDLARNRDLPDPASENGRFVCGFNPTCGSGRHARRRAGHGGRGRARARHHRQLRLPPDHARLGQHAHLPRLHRGDARDRRVADGRRSVRLPPGSVGRARPRPPVRRRSGSRRPARPPPRLQRAGRARGDAPRRSGAPLRRPGRVGRATRRLAPGAVRAFAGARRRARRRVTPRQADAVARGARGSARGRRGQADGRAAVPQDPDRPQSERRRPRGLPRLGLATGRQPRSSRMRTRRTPASRRISARRSPTRRWS